MFEKELGKLGKDMLITLVSGMDQEIPQYENKHLPGICSCSQCCFSKIEDKEYCNSYCNLRKRNPLNVFNMFNKVIFSKTQIKQVLALHLHCNLKEDGFIPHLSVKSLANKIGCTTKSVLNNFKKFNKLGIIISSKVYEDVYSIYIPNYKTYHLSKKEGGNGYIQLSKEFFQELIKINSLNSLKLDLRKLLKSDNESIKKDQTQVPNYSFKQLKNITPQYTHYKSAIFKILNNCCGAFYSEYKNNSLLFKLKDEFNGKMLKKEKEKMFRSDIENHIKNLSFNDIQKEFLFHSLNSLVELALQYSVDTVKKAILLFYDHVSNIKSERNYILNIGPFMRSIINRLVYKKILS